VSEAPTPEELNKAYAEGYAQGTSKALQRLQRPLPELREELAAARAAGFADGVRATAAEGKVPSRLALALPPSCQP
jgi:hypothetical protein